MDHTHRVAAVGSVLYEDKFLLLKRRNAPLIWGPPGGRLEEDEDPQDGLRREIDEECGLQIEIIQAVDIWYGNFGHGKYLSLDYLCTTGSDQVRLSDEHEAYQWASLDDLRQGRPPLGQSEPSFRLADFENAWNLHTLLSATNL